MPIQQHPLPQDITNYKFRLIGDMTIRQFLYIGGFIIITILIHNSPIPFFFRYPLEVLTLGLGIGLAFIPVHGRPLDQWIIAFIKSIYSPTQYTWQQGKKEEIIKTATKKASPQAKTPQTSPSQAQSEGSPAVAGGLATSTTTLDISKDTLSPVVTQINIKKPKTLPNKPQVNIKKALDNPNLAKPQDKDEQIPAIAKPQLPTVNPTLPSRNQSEGSPAVAGGAPTANLPIPFTPEQPNTVVGLTLNNQGLILEGVLIEIISNGLTIRATKSNKLGQFLFAKALENGLYQIKAEKDGFRFATYSINLDGNIVKPLKIQSQP
jgi:hypothetical protein